MKITHFAFLPALLLIVFSSFEKDKPVLFLLGDSISLQYGTQLEKNLEKLYKIERKGSQEKAMQNLDVPIDANGGDSKMVLEYLKSREKQSGFKPDLLVLNCGLHDIKRNPKTKKINIDSNNYRNNLEEIYRIVSEKKIQMIWVRTTDVIDSLHAAKSKAFDRYAADVITYNEIADQVFKKHNVPEIDLYTFTRTFGNERFADHAHYKPEVIRAQADYITAFIKNWKQKFKK